MVQVVRSVALILVRVVVSSLLLVFLVMLIVFRIVSEVSCISMLPVVGIDVVGFDFIDCYVVMWVFIDVGYMLG